MNESLAAEIKSALYWRGLSTGRSERDAGYTVYHLSNGFFESINNENRDWWPYDNAQQNPTPVAWVSPEGDVTIAQDFKDRYILDRLTK